MGLKKQQEYARQLETLRQITVHKMPISIGEKSWNSKWWTKIIHIYFHSSPRCNFSSAHRVNFNQRPASRNKSASRWKPMDWWNLSESSGPIFFPFIHTPTRLCCKKHPTTELSLRNLKVKTIATNHLLFQAAIGQQHHHFQWFRGFWAGLSYFTPPFLWFSSNIPAASADFCSFHDSNNR